MGLFSGPTRAAASAAAEERATYYAPSAPTYIGGAADVVVTATSAAQSVAIRSSADLIASLASELPITEFEGTRSARKEVPTSGNLEDPGGDGTGREDWGYRFMWSSLLTGNTFGVDIDQDARGRGTTVDIFSPESVSPSVVGGQPVWYVNGKEVPKSRFRHWRVNPMPGRLLGLSPIEHHAATIGVSLATTRFGRDWFRDGAHPAGLLTNSVADLTTEQVEIAKARVLASEGSREPLVLGKGWGWSEIQVSPEESQFLQTSGMSEAQCCRIFGPGLAEVLGYETGSTMTYSNIVDRRQDLLVLTMNRWFRRYERVLSSLTPPGHWVEVNRDALLEATTLQRYQAHGLALAARWRTINEVREIEHLDPVEWGNEPNTVAAATPTITKTETGDGNTTGA